jgi:hypothetical protein
MDAEQWWKTVESLLGFGLAIETTLTSNGYMVRVSGGAHDASGVAESFFDAFRRATWRWVLN